MMTKRMKRANVVAGFVVLAATSSALAQPGAVDPLPDPQLPAPDETIAEQLYPCNPGDYQPSSPVDMPDVPNSIDCGEVIIPPRGIDPGIEAPAPEPYPGTTPVIPPSAIEP